VLVEAGPESDDVGGSVIDSGEVGVLGGGSTGATVADVSVPGVVGEEVGADVVGEGETGGIGAARAGEEQSTNRDALRDSTRDSRGTHNAPQQVPEHPER